MTQAAFAIMKGEPLPLDPLSGQPYQWDEATRVLAVPNKSEFKERATPIIVPQAP